MYVGIHYDEEQKEYLVNGVPLDPNKLYSVATSDFVSGGDTGIRILPRRKRIRR